jgi:hypothetical protein
MRTLALWTIFLAACQTTGGTDDAKSDDDTDGPDDTDVSMDSDDPDDTDAPDDTDDPDDSDTTDDSDTPIDSDVPMDDCTDGPALIAGVAYPSLAAAIAASDPGDTVEICPGTHTGSYAVMHDLTLVGLSGQRPELDADGFRLIDLLDGDLTLDRLLLTGANGDDGSVIRNQSDGTLTLRQVHVVGNLSDGRGILDGGTSPIVLDNTRVESNTVDSNDALVVSDGPVSITDSVFASNTATRAANILWTTTSLELTGVEFVENTTEDAPVVLADGALTADRLTLMSNVGATTFAHQHGAADVRNLTVTGNWALSGSVVLFLESDPLTLTGADLTANIVVAPPGEVSSVLSLLSCVGAGAGIDVVSNVGGENAWGVFTLNSTLTLARLDVSDFTGEFGVSFQGSDIQWLGGALQSSDDGVFVYASTLTASDVTFDAAVGDWAIVASEASTVDVVDGQAFCTDAGFISALTTSQVTVDSTRVRDAEVVAATDASIATIDLVTVALDITADVCVDGVCSPLAAGPAVSACVGTPCP